MSHITANRVSEFTATSGTGPLILSAARGYKRFSSVMNIGDQCWYSIDWFSPVNGEALAYEYGIATYSAIDTLTRTEVQESSSGLGVLHPFPSGKKRVSMAILAPDSKTSAQWREALEIGSSDGSSDTGSALALLVTVSAFMRTQISVLGNQ